MVNAIVLREGEHVYLHYESEAGGARALPVVLEVAILKGDAMSWVLEKAVELGVAEVVPVLAEHCVVKLDRKGPEAFMDRWQKIADQALKQCGRTERMTVSAPRTPAELVRDTPAQHVRVWFDEGDRERTPFLGDWLRQNEPSVREAGAIRILTGPEGGWSDRERQILREVNRLSLGPQVLRAETAALFGISVITAFLQTRSR